MTESSTTDKEQQLRDQVDNARQSATVKPTARNIKEMKRAQKTLEQYLASASEPQSAGKIFDSILDVIEYLGGEGYKIGKSSAYDHWKREGKISARPDGTFAQAEVDRYAREHLQKRDGSGAVRNMAEQKQAAEIRQKNADAEMRELKLRKELGELIPRSRVEIEFSERATHLKNFFDAVARSSAGRIIKLVGGDPQRSAELISFALGINRKAFDNYSRALDLGDEEDENHGQ